MQKKLTGDIIKVLISSIFTLAVISVSAVLLLRALGPAEAGRLISIYIIPGMLIRLTMLGSRKTAISHLSKNEYSDNEIVSSLLFIWIFSSLMAVVICIVNFAIMQHADMTLLTHIFVISTIPLRLFIVYSISIFFGKTKFNFSGLFKLLPDLLNLIIILFFVYSGNLDIEGAVVAYFLSSLFVAVLCFIILIQNLNIKFEYNKHIIKSLSTAGLINALTLFIMQLNYRFDMVLLYKYSTNYEVGIYAIGTGLTFVIWLIPDTIGLIIRKRISKSTVFKYLKNEITALLRVSLISGTIISVILYFLIPYIITFIFGNSYSDSAIIFRNILPGVFSFIFFRTLSGIIKVICKADIFIKIFIPVLIINILLCLYLIPLYGGIGAAWASNVSYASGSIATLIVFSFKMKISLFEIFSFNINDFGFIKKLVNIGSRKN